MAIINEMRLDFLSIPENEAFARMAISAFIVGINPTLEQLGDIKTAVSEAVTNAIIHAYPGRVGTVRMHARLSDTDELRIDIIDRGIGIADVKTAMQPFFTTEPDSERSGMGFTVMESFMDGVEVKSAPRQGTSVRMVKNLGAVPPASARMA